MIDDLHAANQDVALLTRFIAQSLHRFPLVLLATWRAQPAMTTDAHGELDAMALDTRASWNSRRSPRTTSRPTFGCADSDSTNDEEVACLLAATGGNPMYLAELVRHPSTDSSRRGLALRAHDRVSTLGVEQRQILGAAALLGAGATVAETAEGSSSTPAEVIDTIHDCASGAALLGDEIRFSHDLLRDALVAALHDGQRQAFHAAASTAIRGRAPVDTVRRAQHGVHGRPLDRTHASRYCSMYREAAQALQDSLAFEQAVEWASRASALAHSSSDHGVDAELRLVHADAVLACGRLNDARELYATAVKPAEEAGDARFLARAALGMGGIWVEEQRDGLVASRDARFVSSRDGGAVARRARAEGATGGAARGGGGVRRRRCRGRRNCRRRSPPARRRPGAG